MWTEACVPHRGRPLVHDWSVDRHMQGMRRHLLMPQSFATPLCHLPAGSGNGISATCGLWSPVTAVHAIIKGTVKAVDAASVFLASESVPRLAVLSVQYGLLPNIDIGTENLRKVLGGERFTYGAVKEVLRWKKHSANIAFFEAPAAEMNLESNQPGCVCHAARVGSICTAVFGDKLVPRALPALQLLFSSCHNAWKQLSLGFSLYSGGGTPRDRFRLDVE